MALYLKKTFKFGPFSINLSKSGIGFSAGIKGARVSKGPRGTFVNIGKNGIYYRKSLTSFNNIVSENSKAVQSNNGISNKNIQNIDFQNIETTDLNNLVDSEFEEEFREIQKKFSCGFFGDKKIYLFYNIDEEKEEKMSIFYDSYALLQKCNKAWWLYSQAKTDNNIKRDFGNAEVLNKTMPFPPSFINYGIPRRFITNIKVPVIPLGKQIYFFPDRIFITEGKQIGTVNYKDLILEYGKMHMVFQSDPPKDSKLVNHVWQYANKDGTPDKRHQDNQQLPVYEIGQINFKSETGLNESVQFSNPEAVEKFVKALEEYTKEL
jgi:hypothetical protein